MKILVTGSSGLVGSALLPSLETEGHRVVRLVRSQPASDQEEVFWDPQAEKMNPTRMEGFDGIVHLAGENVAAGRWTAGQKGRIRKSRVDGTSLLSKTLAQLARPPEVLVAASAVGYYGDRGDEWLREESSAGTGFLSDVCRTWEAATMPAAQKGIRVVNLRIGFVLSQKGGGLAKMLVPFRMGLGGVVGDGKQYLSWIAIDDLVRVIHHCLVDRRLQGAVNATTPHPVTNREFTRTLAKVLGRPALFPLPAFVARMAFGEMAGEVLLAGQRVAPARLQATNFTFQYRELEPALRHLLAKST